MTHIGIAMAIKNPSPALPLAVESLKAFGVSEIAVSDASGLPATRAAFAPLEAQISHYFFEPDRGQSHGLNKAFAALTSPVVGWLNHDDFLVGNGAEKVVDLFGASDVVFGESVFMDVRGRTVGYHPNVSEDTSRLDWENCVAQPSCFFRRSLFDDVGGLNEALHYTMDWDLWRRMRATGARLTYTPQLLSGVMLDPEAKTARFDARRVHEIDGLLRESAIGRLKRLALVTESMKTSVLWFRSKSHSPHPYFRMWTLHGGELRAPGVANGHTLSTFSLAPLTDGVARIAYTPPDGRRREHVQTVAQAPAFSRIEINLPCPVAQVDEIGLS